MPSRSALGPFGRRSGPSRHLTESCSFRIPRNPVPPYFSGPPKSRQNTILKTGDTITVVWLDSILCSTCGVESIDRSLEPDFVCANVLVADVPRALVEEFREPTGSMIPEILDGMPEPKGRDIPDQVHL